MTDSIVTGARIIDKPVVEAAGVSPNLADYDTARRTFSWDALAQDLDGLPDGGLNIAHEAVDRHVAAGRGAKPALVWIGKDGERRQFTYADLADAAARFAAGLRRLGIGREDRVFCLANRVPELYIAALGTLKAGAVFAPLFSAFGPEPIKARLTIGDGKALVTTAGLYRRKVAQIRGDLPALDHVIVIPDGGTETPGTLPWDEMTASPAADSTTAPTAAEDMALLHFTSGTTGKPKGAIHVHGAVLHHLASARFALDLHPDDIFWCTADPGWVTGTSYGIIAPLVIGCTMIVDEGEFDAERWYARLSEERVTVWYTAPTAIRMMMKYGAEAVRGHDLSSVRFMASVGEPLNPEAVVWSREAFGKPFHDNWWQTETGGIMIANYASMPVKPGSMGRPLPGITAAIVERLDPDDPTKGVRVVDEPMVPGELALKPGWPSMTRGYLHDDARYAKAFVDGWYLSGDLAMVDADGYFWFVGRADDVIKTAGHLIGPFEVESALMEHPAVAEVGVIGVPDEVAGEVVKAFVALKPGHEAGEALRKELMGHARKRLGPAVAPRDIAFRENLPKTRSGKIMRRLLKARELGLAEGDTSTLESDEK
ncbi:MAG: acetate--CoA ligase [Azospirillaceae bacterium]